MNQTCRGLVVWLEIFVLFVFASGCRRSIPDEKILPQVVEESSIVVSELLCPHRVLEFSVPFCPAGVSLDDSDKHEFSMSGIVANHSVVVDLRPNQEFWDLSEYNLVRLDVTNDGNTLAWVEARLDNPNAVNWQKSIPSQIHLLPGESGTIGIAMYRDKDSYQGPKEFAAMRAKPNGHREHWREFDPTQVEKIRLVIRSADDQFKLSGLRLSAAHPYEADASSKSFSLPYLDKYGQAKSFDWDGKIHDDAEFDLLSEAIGSEKAVQPKLAGGQIDSPVSQQDDIELDLYGGWKNGPQLEATGNFRTAKYRRKWWLVTPEGHLFWSIGVNAVARPVNAQVTHRKPLFDWLPDEKDPVFGDRYSTKEKKLFFDFRGANLIRRYGEDWKTQSAMLAQKRMKSWGLNTAGAWSSSELTSLGSIPYTPLVYVWFPKEMCVGQTPDPFHEQFAQQVRDAIDNLTKRIQPDEWCVGIFVCNEIPWPKDLIEQVWRQPDGSAAKRTIQNELRNSYKTIGQLNASWETSFGNWDELFATVELPSRRGRTADFERLYRTYAEAFYKQCAEEIKQAYPQHLYLGSRVHVCPEVVARAAIAHVDIFSLNYYTHLAGVGKIPADADIPIMITEYHFGALDTGVPGWGLMGVLDQRERSRAYAGYLVSALQEKRIVGAHWFAYSDQSAAGNPNANYQIGFVDVLDQPYREMAQTGRVLSRNSYPIRSRDRKLLTELQSILSVTAE